MSRTRGPLVAALVLSTVLALVGCTGGGDGSPKDGDGKDSAASSPSVSDETTATASVTTASLAEQTFDATAHGDDVPGGTITTTLRSVEVTGETMTVRWAFRWDNDDKGDDATTSFDDLGVQHVPTVTDGTNLKVYRPFCTYGGWKEELIISIQACERSVIVSPANSGRFELMNHATVEAWALLPAPQGEIGRAHV